MAKLSDCGGGVDIDAYNDGSGISISSANGYDSAGINSHADLEDFIACLRRAGEFAFGADKPPMPVVAAEPEEPGTLIVRIVGPESHVNGCDDLGDVYDLMTSIESGYFAGRITWETSLVE